MTNSLEEEVASALADWLGAMHARKPLGSTEAHDFVTSCRHDYVDPKLGLTRTAILRDAAECRAAVESFTVLRAWGSAQRARLRAEAAEQVAATLRDKA